LVDPKPNYETPRRLALKAGGWIAGEIWLKSAGLTSRLKLALYDFLQIPGAIGRCGTKIAKKLMTTFLNFNFSGTPVAEGSFGWRWLVNFLAA